MRSFNQGKKSFLKKLELKEENESCVYTVKENEQLECNCITRLSDTGLC